MSEKTPQKPGGRGRKPLRSRGMHKGASKDGPKRSYGKRDHGAASAPRSPRKDGRKDSNHSGKGGHSTRYAPDNRQRSTLRKGSNQSWIWGWHAGRAVLDNPRRTIHEIIATESAAQRIGLIGEDVISRAELKVVPPTYIDKALPRGAAHQGLAVKTAPLQWPDLSTIADQAPDDGLILVLDQITDPHNVGAMLRLASAFGVSALVMQSRKAPPLAGATAKVAVGCLETVPVCLETNVANSLKTLQGFGFHVVGLAGETETTVAEALSTPTRRALVMGAEGPGLRELVAKTCDQLARIPMHSEAIVGQAESLNVATAAGIALYEARRG